VLDGAHAQPQGWRFRRARPGVRGQVRSAARHSQTRSRATHLRIMALGSKDRLFMRGLETNSRTTCINRQSTTASHFDFARVLPTHCAGSHAGCRQFAWASTTALTASRLSAFCCAGKWMPTFAALGSVARPRRVRQFKCEAHVRRRSSSVTPPRVNPNAAISRTPTDSPRINAAESEPMMGMSRSPVDAVVLGMRFRAPNHAR
jgi:hypothetical protein